MYQIHPVFHANSSNRRRRMTRNDFPHENPSDPAQYLRIRMAPATTTKWSTSVITGTWHTDGNITSTGKVGHPRTTSGFMKTTWTHRISLWNTSPRYRHAHPCNELEEGGVQGQHAPTWDRMSMRSPIGTRYPTVMWHRMMMWNGNPLG